MSAKKLAQRAVKRLFSAIFRSLGELFRAHAHTGPSRAKKFAHRAQKHGDVETNNTSAHPQQGTVETGIASAPEICANNARFSPAKAMAVSIRRTCERAKAMAVSPQLEVEAVMVPPVSRRRRVAPNTQTMH